MQFGHALPHLLRKIVTADPRLGLVFMSKTDLADAYMRVWIRIQDVPKLAFIIPLAPGNPNVLVGFHLSFPMGYLESAPLFCATTKTISGFANNDTPRVSLHPLDLLADCALAPQNPAAAGVLSPSQEAHLARYFSTLPPSWQRDCLSYTDVYVHDFILLQQGLPEQRLAAQRNLFHHIDRVFCPNNRHDSTRREVNSTKTLKHGDAISQLSRKSWAGRSIA